MKVFVKRLLTTLGASALTLSCVTLPAYADDFGFCNANTGCRADDVYHDFCSAVPWSSTWGAPFWDSMVNLEAQTDVDVQHYSSCGGGTDVIGWLGDNSSVGSNTLGYNQCQTFVAGKTYTCDKSYIYVNTQQLFTYEQRRHTFCHETGHSVGLTHSESYGGCMKSGRLTLNQLSAHHVQHVNAAY